MIHGFVKRYFCILNQMVMYFMEQGILYLDSLFLKESAAQFGRAEKQLRYSHHITWLVIGVSTKEINFLSATEFEYQ